MPQGRDDKVDQASGRSYGCSRGRAWSTALKRDLSFSGVLVPDRIFLNFLHFFGDACLTDIACYLVEEVLQCRFVIVQDRCRETTRKDGIFRPEKLDMHFLLSLTMSH